MRERRSRLLAFMFALTTAAATLPHAPAARAQSLQPGQTVQAMDHRNLMPVPQSIDWRGGRMKLDASFTSATLGYTDARLQRAVARAVKRLGDRTGLEFTRATPADPWSATLVIRCGGAAAEVPQLGEDESYSLEVAERQTILTAPNVVGVMRGLETFLQLLEGDRSGYFMPQVRINDRPRFPWRGLLIDVCRHWEPADVIKRNLDGMAAVKLNVLHLHLTENQGFRVESRAFPKLHQQGSDGLYYTQAEVRDIISYAADRGIRVVPEFDVPGHTTAWFVGHPELASAPGPYEIERHYGVFDASMDPTREEVYKFLDRFFGEMAALFPDAYLHIGGDEVTGKHWRLNPQIQAFMSKNNIADKQALQAYFNRRVSQILTKHGKKMIGWDEILHPDLPNNIVVQSWRGQQSLAGGAKKGYAGILSSGYYLDHLLPAEKHYLVDPVQPDANLTPEETARILGGEACMWGEYVGPENIDSRIWPRLAAVAERLWSPRDVVDVADMYRRLAALSVQLEEFGLTHASYRAKMVRRLAGSEQPDAVAALAELSNLVEPIKSLGRYNVHEITQLSPLTRLVDAAGPDSAPAREFNAQAVALIEDAPRFGASREALRAKLTRWHDLHPAIYVAADRSPIARDAEPVARDLSELSAAGLEALDYLASSAAPPPEWRAERLALIERVSREKSEVEFPILTALRQLVNAAAELPQLKTTAPADWKAKVLAPPAEKK
jgi:hexosaminidase